jgi:hypothetical protein
MSDKNFKISLFDPTIYVGFVTVGKPKINYSVPSNNLEKNDIK